ncbi:helix-turn-helix domain-containing protein [Paenibacillus sp. PAMC21692]|uniref:helix-turn-helix domain-containing protein n=1 Tax=Paenibacillus sp. PAMC21692 TaxID=2762320 RepID=UPI00164E32D9|nr:helix-turn-helix domain-containing protein [Paenibacillus sp. PAMC21692]QNK58595.1 helix-turn-helix domain-containing protein [Paenibacillus sp. PAMC21692]
MKFSISHLWRGAKRRKTYAQILVYFIVACVGILVISTLFLYIVSSNTLMRTIGNHSKLQLHHAVETLSFTMNWNLDYAQRSSLSTPVRSYALRSSTTPHEDNLIWNALVGMKDNNPYIDSIYLINHYNRKVVDTRHGVSENDEFYDQDILSMLDRAAQHADERKSIVPRLLESDYITPIEPRIISIIIPLEFDYSGSSFVVNINADALISANRTNTANAGSQLYVLDGNQNIISGNSQTDFLKNFSELGYHYDVARKPGFYEHEGDQSGFLIVQEDIPLNVLGPWTMIEIFPKSEILKDINNLKTQTFIFFGCILLATIWIIWNLSRKIYSPIQELIVAVTSRNRHMVEDHQLSNEFAFLSGVFSEQSQELDAYSRNQRLLAKESFLQELLETDIAHRAERMEQQFNQFRLTIAPERITVAILRIDQFQSFTDHYTDRDQRLLRFGVSNIAKERLQERWPVETVDMGKDHIAVILNLQNESDIVELCQEFKRCQGNIEHYLSIGTTVAVSPLIEQVHELHESYKQTYHLTDARFQLGWGSIISEAVNAEPSNPTFQYPEDKEKLIVQWLKKGESIPLLAQLDAFEILIQKFHYSESKLAATMLLLSIGKTLRQLPIRAYQASDWSLSAIQKQLDQLETLEAVLDWTKRLLGQACSEISSLEISPRSLSIIEEIKNVVNQQYQDQNLSTKLISDQLGLSVNYVRNLFKTEAKQSLMDFITDRRMEEVIKLMADATLTIEEIVLQSGFTSTVSFYPIFKKKYGMTPAAYRKELESKRS